MPQTWPKKIIDMVPSDVCRNDYHTDDGKKHCLLGWISVTFGISTSLVGSLSLGSNQADIFYAALKKRCKRNLADFNDDYRNSRLYLTL